MASASGCSQADRVRKGCDRVSAAAGFRARVSGAVPPLVMGTGPAAGRVTGKVPFRALGKAAALTQ